MPKATTADAEPTGAATPDKVTHAFCLNSHILAWAMLHGTKKPKVIENRQITMAPGWYGVSLSLTTHTSIPEELQYRKLEPSFPGTFHFTKGQIIGLVKIGYSLPQAACAKDTIWAVSSYKIGNIITEVLPFDKPFGPKVRGNFGAYPLKEATEATRALARTELAAGNKRITDAESRLPPASAAQAQAGKAKGKEEEEDKKQVPVQPKAKSQARPPTKRPKAAVTPAAVAPGKVDASPPAKKARVETASNGSAPEKGGDIRSFFGKK